MLYGNILTRVSVKIFILYIDFHKSPIFPSKFMPLSIIILIAQIITNSLNISLDYSLTHCTTTKGLKKLNQKAVAGPGTKGERRNLIGSLFKFNTLYLSSFTSLWTPFPCKFSGVLPFTCKGPTFAISVG